DSGFRFGRHGDPFGSLPPKPAPMHPFLSGGRQGRSLTSHDPEWRDVYGHKSPSAGELELKRSKKDGPLIYQLKGGVTVMYLGDQGKKPPAASAGATPWATRRSESVPAGAGAKPRAAQ
ncbi:unnamed protein product, partial [Prorocentrum cordatum]